MFFFAKAFAHDLNEEYLIKGTGELIRVIPENEQYKLGDQRYIEQLEDRLKKAESEILFYKQQIEIKDEQYRNVQKQVDEMRVTLSDYQRFLHQENKKDLAGVG